jgi:hypothetical protein
MVNLRILNADDFKQSAARYGWQAEGAHNSSQHNLAVIDAHRCR